MSLSLAAIFCLAFVVGCKLPPPPDPNDPNDVTVIQIDVLRRNLDWASQAVNDRVAKGEITVDEGKKILSESAQHLLHSVKIDQINVVDAWQYGDVFRTAEDWELAKRAYGIAVNQAVKSKIEDRRVNDSLHLAQAMAHLGETKQAIAMARSTFDCKPQEKVPILMSVLYEIVPGARGKDQDAELAKLLEDAIHQHELAIVNADSVPGKAFLATKSHHLMRAWEEVVSLYRSAGMEDDAEKARIRGSEQMASHQRV